MQIISGMQKPHIKKTRKTIFNKNDDLPLRKFDDNTLLFDKKVSKRKISNFISSIILQF